MYFTEGRLREYERMMREKPKREHEFVTTVRDQDSENCLHAGKYSENRTSPSDESGVRIDNCNRFFNTQK